MAGPAGVVLIKNIFAVLQHGSLFGNKLDPPAERLFHHWSRENRALSGRKTAHGRGSDIGMINAFEFIVAGFPSRTDR
jgi:hypothetical protein